MKITVIGESNIDISVVPHAEPSAKGCTPGNIAFHHGGVARNIAHNLCLLKQEVRLMTVFGGDDFAQGLVESCTKLGMDVSLSERFEEEKSPIFLSFNDKQGNMQSAVSDIGLNCHLDLDFAKTKMDEINRSEMVVADTLLSSEAIAYLIDHVQVPFFIDAVSPRRSLRIAEALELSKKKTFYALKCNQSEAQALSGTDDVIEAAKVLNAMGIQEVFITLGADGVVYSSSKLTQSYPALSAEVVNATGSGDAFLAGVVFAHTQGITGEAAVPYGLKAAKASLEVEEMVNPDLQLP